MGKWYLISINITNKDKKLLNKNDIPIGLDWNVDDDLMTTIVNDIQFQEYVKKTCFSVSDYASSKLSYFAFNYADGDNDDNYEEKSFKIQDFFKLKEDDDIVIEYLLRIFKMMYKSFLKEEYEDEIMFSDENVILDIYDKIKEKYPERFIKESVVNYVRMQLMKTYELNNDNIETCIKKIQQILSDKA